MVSITKTEIRWVLGLIEVENHMLNDFMENNSGQIENYEIELAKLRFENLNSLAERLEKTLYTNAKRIAVK